MYNEVKEVEVGEKRTETRTNRNEQMTRDRGHIDLS